MTSAVPGDAAAPPPAPAGLRERFRSHPAWGDALLTVLMSPFTVLGTISATTASGGRGRLLALGVGLAFTVPLLWRRTRPEAVAGVLVVVCLAQLALYPWFVGGDLVVPVVMFTLARHVPTRRSRLWLAVGLLGSVLAGVKWGLWEARRLRPDAGLQVAPRMGIWAALCGLVVLTSWFSGQSRRQRDLTLQSLRDRAAALEVERDTASRLAAEEERSRIAREMHDVVAHSLSVIVVQSDGAGYLAEHSELGDAEARLAQVRQAIATINTTAREALGETRRLVGVLRHEGEEMELAPSATLAQIGDLVQRLEAAGVPASFLRTGSPDLHVPLAPGAEMALHRVAQEALTNVLKHAGSGARVQVTLAEGADAVELRVTDTGRGARPSDGAGHGLVGMRERMAAWDGSLDAGPVRDAAGRHRGFEVRARVPVDAAHPTGSGPTSSGPTSSGQSGSGQSSPDHNSMEREH